MVSPTTLNALSAYQNQLKLLQGTPDTASPENTQASFSQMVEEAAKDASNTMHNAENLQMQDITGGKVDLTDLVTAVSSAELTLNTVVAVRDKVIGAYQSIISMSI